MKQPNIFLFVQRGLFMVPLWVFRCHTVSEGFPYSQLLWKNLTMVGELHIISRLPESKCYYQRCCGEDGEYGRAVRREGADAVVSEQARLARGGVESR